MGNKDLKLKIFVAAICAVTLLGTAGCSGNSESGKTSSKVTDTEESSTDSQTADGQKVEVYLAEDGTPYYIDSDGSKMMLFSTPFADDDDDGYDEGYDDYDYSQDFIRGEYDVDNLKFTVPDGWFAENSFGAPTIFQDYADGEEINYDETISIVPTFYVFEADEDGNVTEDVLKNYFKELTDSDFYSDYKILESGEINVAGIDAMYYDIYAEITNEYDNSAYLTRYIITPGDNSHCFILAAKNDEVSFNMIKDTFNSFSDTIVLPTADQMSQFFE